MESLSQLDIKNPDHVTVITRDNKVMISVSKDGTSITLSVPTINSTSYTSRTNVLKVVKSNPNMNKRQSHAFGLAKLDESQVKEIRMMLSDAELMDKFSNVTNAYEEIGRAYQVTGATISNIARNVSWKHVTV